MAGLSAEQIQALLSKTREKGVYVLRLNQFIESGQEGICVNEEYVDLAGKKATTLKQGFENAKDKKDVHDDAKYVKVIAQDDQVFLINLKVAGMAADAEPEAAAA